MANGKNRPKKDRPTTWQEALRRLLSSGVAGTQEELCEKLCAEGFEVTQSTISRGLRKIGAIKATDEAGRMVYRLVQDIAPPPAMTALHELITEIKSNGSIIVIQTPPGSASLVARHLDHYKPGGILGTIAGDDTIFVAPTNVKSIPDTIEDIRSSLRSVG